MAAPNIEGTSNLMVLNGGVTFGASVGNIPADLAGMHGSAAAQVTGFGVPTGGALLTLSLIHI